LIKPHPHVIVRLYIHNSKIGLYAHVE